MFNILYSLVYLSSNFSFSSPILYYQNNFPYHQQICTNLPVFINIHDKYHEKISNYTWNITSSHECQSYYNNETNFSFVLSCKEAENVKITLDIILKDSFNIISYPFYLNFQKCPENSWYLQTKPIKTTLSKYKNITIDKLNHTTIMDPYTDQIKLNILPISYFSSSIENLEANNNNYNNTKLLFKSSMELSKVMNSLGHLPKLKILTDGGYELNDYSLSEIHFNSKKSLWTSKLSFSGKSSLNVYIYSDSFMIGNKSIQNTINKIYPNFFNFKDLLIRAKLFDSFMNSNIDEIQLNLSLQKMNFNGKIISRIPNLPHYSLIHIKPNIIATTINNFNTIQFFYIYPVDNLILTSDGLLFINKTNTNILTFVPFVNSPINQELFNNNFSYSQNNFSKYQIEDKVLNHIIQSF